ncbi:MAG: carboxypeptidase-like regulatory domain-containing protein [Flavobacteriales bacterium]|nr:carboxypeptidase-like regulatory domain-containing protein [Flavobacteriales bacterium]
MKLIRPLLFLSVLIPVLCSAQQDSTVTYTLIGTVVDGNTNELLMGANIVSSRNFGTKTSEIGEFSIHTQSNDTLTISFVGYKTLTYITPERAAGRYLIKFRMYHDSISLKEVVVFPYPTFQDFKDAFLAQDKQHEKIEMQGVKTYVDRDVSYKAPSVFSPASFIYDKLFDKKARLNRTLKRRKDKIEESTQEND